MKIKLIKLLSIAVITAGVSQTAFSADQTRQVSGFTAISSSGSFHIYVKIDGTESLKISADDAVIDQIETIVEKGTLKIRYKNEHMWSGHNVQKEDIYITAKSLSALESSGSGSIKVENTITATDFKAALSGSGSISTDVKADAVHASISGSGNINLHGTANDASISISGSGNIVARDLQTQSAKVSISGSGNVHIAADKELITRIAGSGSVRYSGNASITTSNFGSGSVRKE